MKKVFLLLLTLIIAVTASLPVFAAGEIRSPEGSIIQNLNRAVNKAKIMSMVNLAYTDALESGEYDSSLDDADKIAQCGFDDVDNYIRAEVFSVSLHTSFLGDNAGIDPETAYPIGISLQLSAYCRLTASNFAKNIRLVAAYGDGTVEYVDFRESASSLIFIINDDCDLSLYIPNPDNPPAGFEYRTGSEKYLDKALNEGMVISVRLASIENSPETGVVAVAGTSIIFTAACVCASLGCGIAAFKSKKK